MARAVVAAAVSAGAHGAPSAPVARVQVRREDFHITRYQQRSATTTVFVVDASGSSALNRLAEAKGAVELLLADCYVRRDQVAVLSFRGRSAELLLPPTRSLVRAKRSLAGLPGGGGTPLASGIDAAAALGQSIARRGETPIVVLLTDGRGNVSRDGSPGRAKAAEDVELAACQYRMAGLSTLLIDTSPQPQAAAQELARTLGAAYLPLPYAGSAALPFAPRFFAGQASDPRSVERLIDSTGSTLDAEARAFYARLVRNPGHVAGALAMMANWDVGPLLRDLPRLGPKLVLVVADKDLTVPPAQGTRVRSMWPDPSAVELHRLKGLGHLAHEEDPAQVAALCIEAARAAGVFAPH